ncbi:MAG: hypothetical protein IKU34_04690 [Clostridia bacterium]|nr:hypothetical protein [Clostridia bacterium]
MGVYQYSYITSEKTYQYMYRCSKCGKLVVQHSTVTGTSDQYNGRGTMTQKSQDQAKRRATAAKTDAIVSANTELDRLVKKVRRKNFKDTQITGQCPLCAHQEPWQRLSKSGLAIPMTCFSLMFLFIGIGLLVTDETGMGAKLTGAGAAIILLLLFGSHQRKKRAQQASDMPEASLPHIFLSQAEFIEACESLDKKADEQIYDKRQRQP